MSNTREPKANDAIVAQATRHIRHHGGEYEDWYVGIEDHGTDRDNTVGHHPMHYPLKSEDEAKLTMSSLLGMGLMADDEYGVEPSILFIYSSKKQMDT